MAVSPSIKTLFGFLRPIFTHLATKYYVQEYLVEIKCLNCVLIYHGLKFCKKMF